jgi:hypothetical protein
MHVQGMATPWAFLARGVSGLSPLRMARGTLLLSMILLQSGCAEGTAKCV